MKLYSTYALQNLSNKCSPDLRYTQILEISLACQINDAFEVCNLKAIMEGVWHQGNEQWPSSDNKAPTRVKVRQTPRNESTTNKSDVLQPSPLITLDRLTK
jgi:hypothetical protein